jgi:predicted metal-dependent hydrolase
LCNPAERPYDHQAMFDSFFPKARTSRPAAKRPALLRMEHLEVDTPGGPVPVALRRDRRARNYTLRVKGAVATPTLTMPFHGSLREARTFLDRHRAWLLRQLEKAPLPRPVANGAPVPFRGVPHRIRCTGMSRGAVVAAAEGGESVLIVPGAEAHLRRRLFDFLKHEAKRDLDRAVTRHAETLGVTVKSIRVRDTSSRWGSCTTAGNLSFSFRLVMAPPFVLDYLAAHEVAHLREMNHSRRFWKVVQSLCPDHGRARAWLVAYGPGLHAVGA